MKFEEKQGYPVHAVSLVDHQTGIVLSQGHVEKTMSSPQESHQSRTDKPPTEEQEQETQEEKKQKSELAVASRLIEYIDWKAKSSPAMPCIVSAVCVLRCVRQEESICFW